MGGIRILRPDEVRSLSPEQRREYIRAAGRTVIDENREMIAVLAAYDQGKDIPVSPGAHAV